jgi:hypothetical protein
MLGRERACNRIFWHVPATLMLPVTGLRRGSSRLRGQSVADQGEGILQSRADGQPNFRLIPIFGPKFHS